ncbi:MAG: M48 family metallopeptidase [Planctomycetes bacterium]|nr:M48 family metallopeptidase [Planctomycetota bacterium]
MSQRVSLAGRASLALMLMVGFYLLALGICAGLAWLVFADAQSHRIHPKLWIMAVVVIGTVIYSVWPRRVKFPDPGVPLRRQDQPRLWSMVDEVARAAGQEPPRQIFLVPDINAFVAERNSVLGLGGERIMGIGLPLLQVLTLPQAKSVIAHEFGHYHGGDTRLGPFIYKTREAIGRTIVNFRNLDSILHKPFEWYGKLYLRATFAISRAQEYAADALSVRLVGREPVLTALRRVNETGPLFDHYLEGEFLPMLNRNRRPPLAQGFRLYLGSKAVGKLQVEFGEQAMQAKGNPYDSHPALPDRLRAAAAVESPGAEAAAGPLALTLIDDLAKVEEQLLVFMTGKPEVRKVPATSWRDSGAAYGEQWQEVAAGSGRKLPAMRVADLVAHVGEIEQFAALTSPKVPKDSRRAAGAWLVTVLFGEALRRAGFVLETSPGDPLELVRGDVRLNPFEVVGNLIDGKITAADWPEFCAHHGVGDLLMAGPELPVLAPAAGRRDQAAG